MTPTNFSGAKDGQQPASLDTLPADILSEILEATPLDLGEVEE